MSTGEITDGDGDAGDGGESEVVEGAEIGHRLRERRVPVDHRVLGLHRRSDVGIHLEIGSRFLLLTLIADAAGFALARLTLLLLVLTTIRCPERVGLSQPV